MQALAQPELATIARMAPLAAWTLDTRTGAAFTLFEVKTAAAAQGFSEKKTERSGFVFLDPTPAWTPEARKPKGS